MAGTITAYQILDAFAATLNTAGALDFTFASSSGSATDQLTGNGRDIILAYNSGSATGTVSVASVADEKNRTGNISSYSMAAGDFACIPVGLTNNKGWMDSSKKITITTSSADLKLAALRLPDGYPS